MLMVEQADLLKCFTADIDRDDPVILICRTGGRTCVLAHMNPTFEMQYIKGLL